MNAEKKKHGLGLAGGLTGAFIKSPLTPLILLASLAVGLIALISLPREEEPQISVPLVDIHVQADGLKAEDAVKLVTEPLETIVKGIDQVEHVYSDTRDDRVMVTARFEVGVSADSAILRVRDKILANLDRIPVGIPQPLVVGRGINDVAIVSLTFSPADGSANVSASDLTRLAREVEIRLSRIENVGLTYLIGAKDEELRIAPNPEKLALYGITLQQLAGKVKGANTSAPAGTVREDGEQLALVIGGTLSTPEETSTAAAPLRRTAIATLDASRPPESMTGSVRSRPAIRRQSKVTPLPPGNPSPSPGRGLASNSSMSAAPS